MADLDTALIVGFGAGLYSFFKGFRVYRECRILEDTPEMPIRSIAMGLVHIHGKACGDQLVSSPVSHTPCLFYKVDIEKWKTDSQNRGSWTHYRTDANGVRFHLQDATGKVLIDAHRAEYDLIQTIKRETGRGSGFGNLVSGMGAPAAPGGPGAGDEALINYAESLPASAGGGSVLGSLGQVTLGASLNLGASLTLGRSRSTWLGNGSRRYRFTEYCILPEHWYDVTGTCVENPEAKDQHDRNLIQKGENEPTFLISWRAEREIEKTLRRRSALQVFGGAALSVICLGVLLKKLGWL